MFSHTLLGPDKIRVLAGDAGLNKHIFVVAWQSLTAVPTHPAPCLCKVRAYYDTETTEIETLS